MVLRVHVAETVNMMMELTVGFRALRVMIVIGLVALTQVQVVSVQEQVPLKHGMIVFQHVLF